MDDADPLADAGGDDTATVADNGGEAIGADSGDQGTEPPDAALDAGDGMTNEAVGDVPEPGPDTSEPDTDTAQQDADAAGSDTDSAGSETGPDGVSPKCQTAADCQALAPAAVCKAWSCTEGQCLPTSLPL